MNNPYETLGVPENATEDEIKAAYRKKAAETHPDKGGEPGAFVVVKDAFDILSDKDERAYYDENGKAKEKVKVEDCAKTAVAVAIQEVILSGFNVKNADLILEARRYIKGKGSKNIGEAGAEKRSLEARRDKFREAIDRTSSSDEFDIILITLNNAERELGKAIKAIEDDIKTEEKVTEAALAILEKYSYEFESERSRLDSYFRTGGTASLWSSITTK